MYQLEGARHLDHAGLRGALADTQDAVAGRIDAATASVQFGADYN